MPKCLMAKHGVSIHTDGRLSPCCSWRDLPGEKYVFSNSIDWTKRHRKIYEDLKSDWLPQCKECQLGEQENSRSLRTDSQRYFNTQSSGIEYWDFKLNNSCNLSCKMCGAHSSSAWARDIKNNPELRYTVFAGGINKPKMWKEEGGLNIEDFYPELVNAKYVKFTGGEPFLIPEVKKCIEFLVDCEASHNIQLQIITNGTQDLIQWLPLFKQFKHVILSISAEATGELYEYIRQGAVWEEVAQNVTTFQKQKPDNVHMTMNYLPMALNIGAEKDLKAWCDDNNIAFFRATPVFQPDFMSPDAPNNPILREKLIKNLELLDSVYNTNYKNVIGYLND